jgi:hypothetical protein
VIEERHDSRQEDAAAAATSMTWLVLVYRVPSEPTRLRSAVWRKLKSLGAIYLQQSVAVLPASPKAERALRALRKGITEDMAGQAVLLSSGALVGGAGLVADFNAAVEGEYAEIVERCAQLRAGVATELDAGRLTYRELEDGEARLAKLQRWYEQVMQRDVLGAARVEAVAEAVAGCRAALREFASRVYEADNVGLGQAGR